MNNENELTISKTDEYNYYESFNLNPKSWDKAVCASEAVKLMPGSISEADLIEWAESRLCPHYRVNGGPPLFNRTKLKDWITWNKIEVCDGKPLCNFISHKVEAVENYKIPSCIAGIDGIIEANLTTVFSGVYFLCKNNEIVYVGQAQSVSNRVGNHCGDGVKDFDSAFCIPVSISLLNAVEQYYIKAFLPKYNKCALSKKAKREAGFGSC